MKSLTLITVFYGPITHKPSQPTKVPVKYTPSNFEQTIQSPAIFILELPYSSLFSNIEVIIQNLFPTKFLKTNKHYEEQFFIFILNLNEVIIDNA